MRNNILTILSLGVCLLFACVEANAQSFNPEIGCVTDVNGQCIPNTIVSAVPFLRITPDARAGGMGDLGIATSVDPNAIHHNASKLAFVEQDLGLSVTYTPWLRDLGLSDVYLAYLAGFKQIDEFQTVGMSLRFFSLGEITFTDIDGGFAGNGKPRELEFAFAYARKLAKNVSAGLTAKYIYSNLASGQVVGGLDVTSANAFAADLSLTSEHDINMGENGAKLRFGLALSNLGSKISYTNSSIKDFIPGNIGLGSALEMELDEYNKITVALDINKLLVPSPVSRFIEDENGRLENPDFDATGGADGGPNGIADFREKATFSGIFGSFADAQGGFSEELRELMFALGFEYWYDNQFAVRAGYYYEDANKGDRKFLTVGVGVKYNVFGINLSYLVPTNNRNNPLNNTLRFTLNFNFDGTQNR